MSKSKSSPEPVWPELQTLRDHLRYAAAHMQRSGVAFGHGTDNAWDEAAALVSHVAGVPWERLPACLDARLVAREQVAFAELLQRRVDARIPLPYLTGIAHFAGSEFEVTEDTLIPRSPIAELIEAGFEPLIAEPPQRVLDLCTGCGCIGIATALALPEAEVVLSDISELALAVARRNIERHGVGERVEAVLSDLFEDVGAAGFDLIVSNPPYVDADDLAGMPAEFRHEPELALASGADGLDFTRRLLAQAASFLNPGGMLLVEVGNSAAALERAFPQLPFLWLEFESGGSGVVALPREHLLLS